VDLSGWVGVGLGGNCDCRCGILYAFLARKLSKPESGRYRPKHVVVSIANKHHHLAIFYSCFFV